uniref:Uncharacterized protein n=1 Tax=Acrobeloides nanus TaxID=290746 RepID=A0A914E1Y9_9BILA
MRNEPFSLTPWSAYSFSLHKGEESKRILCFIPTPAIDKDGVPLPLFMNFSDLRWTFNSVEKKLELYLKFLMMGTSRFIQGLTTKTTSSKYILQQVNMHYIDEFASKLRENWPDVDLLMGATNTYNYLFEIASLLDDYPDGYVAFTRKTNVDKAIPIDLYEPSQIAQSNLIVKSLLKIGDEYRHRC